MGGDDAVVDYAITVHTTLVVSPVGLPTVLYTVDGRTKYGTVRVSAVPYEGRTVKVQACDGTVTVAGGCITALYGGTD